MGTARGGIAPAPVILQIERRRQFLGGLLHLPQVSPDIEIQRCACVDVAQNLLDALNIRAIPQKQGGTAVPQVVGREVRQTVGFHKPLDAAGRSVGVAGLEYPRLAGENEAVRKDGAGGLPFPLCF